MNSYTDLSIIWIVHFTNKAQQKKVHMLYRPADQQKIKSPNPTSLVHPSVKPCPVGQDESYSLEAGDILLQANS